jgi:hypothetical protein
MPRVEVLDFETGLPLEVAEKLRARFREHEDKITALEAKTTEIANAVDNLQVRTASIEPTADGVKIVNVVFSPDRIAPESPNVLRIGTPESYVHEVVAANVTIPSRPVDKENVREVTEEEVKGANLPAVIRYRRRVGEQREEIGFDLDTAPDIVKTDAGIDLKALVALLVLRIRSLEREVERLRNALENQR